MSQVVRVSAETYKRLEKHAKGFDTPSNVIDKLLNHYDGISKPTINKATNRRDTTQYNFNNQIYGKGRLVLSVIKAYVSDNPTINFSELLDIFPRNIQGSSGVFLKIEDAQEIYQRTDHKRHFIEEEEEEIITLSDCTIAVCTQWGSGNIDNFILKAREIGYKIVLQNG